MHAAPLTTRRAQRGRAGVALLASVLLAGTLIACSTSVAGSPAPVARTAVVAAATSISATTAGSATTALGGTPGAGSAAATAPTELTDIVLDPGGREPAQTSSDSQQPIDPMQELPDLPPMGPQVDVVIDARGVITISRGTPKVTIEEYQDPICPPCAGFWEENGVELSKAIAAGKIALRLHSVDFLDAKSASGDYSTRANASLLAVATLAGPNEVIRWETALYSKMLQPEEGGAVDVSNADLADLAPHLGIGQLVSDAITSEQYTKAARAAAATAEAELAKTGQVSVPRTQVGGKQIVTSRAGWLPDLIGT